MADWDLVPSAIAAGPAVATVGQAPVTEGEYETRTMSALAPISLPITSGAAAVCAVCVSAH